MHVPDGFLDASVSIGAGAAAAAAVTVSLRGARRELAGPAAVPGGGERTAPLAGLVAAFVFAVQMLNFPVGAGTSGHLMGGALAAILVGPYTAVLVLSVVLLMQAVLFADGGLTALGVNITLIGVVTVITAYALFRGLLLVLPPGRRTVTAATFVAALASVPVAAAAFTVLYAIGGTAEVPLGKVLTAMVGVHTLIGVGEAVITTLTVGSVLAVRPDLVYGARGLLRRPLTLRTTPVAAPAAAAGTSAAGTSAAVRSDGGPASKTASAAVSDAAVSDAAVSDAAVPDPAAGVPAARSASAAGTLSESAATAGDVAPSASPSGAGRRSARPLWLAGTATALLLAGVVSYYASAAPDGLEKVAGDNGIDERAEEHDLADSPLADYGVQQVADERLSGGLAGVIGVGGTLALGSGIFIAVRRRRSAAPDSTELPVPAGEASAAGTGASAAVGPGADGDARNTG